MQKELIAQLRAKHESELACLTLIENATDADQKNIASQWYESILIDIVEMQVPENEKPEYCNLEDEFSNFTPLDEDFEDKMRDRERKGQARKFRLTVHEEIKVPIPSIAHNLSYANTVNGE